MLLTTLGRVRRVIAEESGMDECETALGSSFVDDPDVN
jgi:hypothetical protein